MSDLSRRVHDDPIVVSGESTVIAEYFSESAEEAKPECSRARLEVRGSRCGSLSDDAPT
jgi:hypothetical protein